ncbi:MAG: OmpA family protein [Proteobacteria bacterium]|nr:OmpA family protein [Pseudomonadota bacterium]
MTRNVERLASLLAGFVVAAGLALGTGPASSQSLEQQINNALTPTTKPETRGLTRGLGGPSAVDPKASSEQQFINRLRTRAIAVEPVTPGGAPGSAPIAAEDRAKIAEIVKEKPKIDLEIFFDYNSAVVGPRALPSLIALGSVLAKPEFRGTVFLINGHTDAAGGAEYNLALSHRRADAVRHVLIQQFKLAPDSLIAAGFGKEQLKNARDPLAGENRRVQIVNTQIKAAGR